MAWGVTVPDTYVDSHIDMTVIKSGAGADRQHKTRFYKVSWYARLTNTHIFYRFDVDYRERGNVAWHGLTADTRDRQTYHHYHTSVTTFLFNAYPWLFKREMRSPFRTP